jgi:TetR/AcrR family transcriptional regulator, cholesterol catabolism regulator
MKEIGKAINNDLKNEVTDLKEAALLISPHSKRTVNIKEDTILDEAYKLFRQRGVRDTNMQHIAKSCGTTVWKISSTYRSKKYLVLALFKYLLQKNSGCLTGNSANSPAAVAELENFFSMIEGIVNGFGAEILAELRRYQAETFEQLSDIVEHNLMPYIQKNLARGASEGHYRDDIHQDIFVTTYFKQLRSILESENLNWEETKTTLRQFHRILLRGVLSLKGTRL